MLVLKTREVSFLTMNTGLVLILFMIFAFLFLFFNVCGLIIKTQYHIRVAQNCQFVKNDFLAKQYTLYKNMNFVTSLIKKFSQEQAQKYSYSFIDISFRKRGKELIILGTVLTKKQKKELLSIFKVNNFLVQDKIQVIEDIENKLDIGWAEVVVPLLDLFRKPQKSFNSVLNRNKARNTQVTKGEILRIIAKQRQYYLVQKNDTTLGWILQKAVKKIPFSFYEQWKKILWAQPNKVVLGSRKKVIDCAVSFLDVPYLLGGSTKQGIDCSGFVQQVYWQSNSIMLPKYSQDQLVYGKAITLDQAKSADVIFVDRKKDSFHHVGILFDKQHIIHASGRMKKVVIWNTKLWWQLYRLIGVRKIIR